MLFPPESISRISYDHNHLLAISFLLFRAGSEAAISYHQVSKPLFLLFSIQNLTSYDHLRFSPLTTTL